MQKTLILLLTLVVAVLAGVCLWQSHEASALQIQLAAAKEQVKQAEAQKDVQQRQMTQLIREKSQRETMESNPAAADAARGKNLSPASGGGASPDSDDKEGFGGMLAKMMKDPEMKKAMAAQQAQMMKTLYGALVKEMKLSPDEAEKFNALLGEHQMKTMEAGPAIVGGDGNKDEAVKKVADETKDFESQMQQLLGDNHYQQYTNYQQTLMDRTTLDQFKGQLGDHPLTDEQSQQLLQLMIAERKSAGAAMPSGLEGLNLMSSEEAMNKLLEQQALASQQVLQKASSFLTQDQVEALGSFQTNQVAMQKLGLEMARKFMGTNKTSGQQIFGAPANP